MTWQDGLAWVVGRGARRAAGGAGGRVPRRPAPPRRAGPGRDDRLRAAVLIPAHDEEPVSAPPSHARPATRAGATGCSSSPTTAPTAPPRSPAHGAWVLERTDPDRRGKGYRPGVRARRACAPTRRTLSSSSTPTAGSATARSPARRGAPRPAGRSRPAIRYQAPQGLRIARRRCPSSDSHCSDRTALPALVAVVVGREERGNRYRRSGRAWGSRARLSTLAAVIAADVLFWASLAALVWTHVALPGVRRACWRGVRQRRVARGRHRADGRGDRRRLQRGAGDRAPDREPARARLPARQAARSSSPPTPRPTAPRRSRCSTRASRVISNPRGGKVAAQDRAVRETDGEIVAFSDANATWAPDALRKLVRAVRRPGRRLRLRAAADPRRPTARTRRASTGATRWPCASAESRLGSVTGGNGSIYARAPRRLRRGRPALRSRPVAAVPDGAARPPRGLRAGGARVREADADERDRVPAQGAHVRALLADRPARARCCAGSARSTCSRSSRTGCCATARGSCTSCCSPRRSRSSRTAGSTTSCSPRSSLLFAAALAGCRDRALLRRSSRWATLVALWNYLRRGVPATWDAPEGTR